MDDDENKLGGTSFCLQLCMKMRRSSVSSHSYEAGVVDEEDEVGVALGLAAMSSSLIFSGVGPHFLKPASFCRNTTRVPCTDLKLTSLLRHRAQ